MSATTSAWLVLLMPLLGSVLLGLGFKGWRGISAGVVGTAAIGLAFLFAVISFFQLNSADAHHKQLVSSLGNYANFAGLDAKLSILVDPLSIVMMLVVTGVSTLIHLYSLAYMRSDQGYVRFFAYLNFFVFSMLLLVLAANFVLLIVGWAFVGAASYMLVSYWYRRDTATKAGVKAFVINVVGDIGLVLGTIMLLHHTGTVDFLTTFERAPEVFGAHGGGHGGGSSGSLTAALLLIMVGAFAKSAQLPFHTWLPDAMEGPTPVSSLIHAATMVTAGVYLIARLHPLMELSPTAQTVGAIVGCLTLLVAGTIGLVVTDLKRVIAYSTMSQIGYMIMAVSSGVYVAGIFHLATHAFFKALLFMSAGSLISAMGGEQSLDKMRGFRKAMPFTYLMFIVGGLALAGIPPLSGFFSKDEILAGLATKGGWHWALYVAGYLGALLTAVYTWRMIFRAFWGEPVHQATELEHGHLYHAPEPLNPATGELEDHEVGFPGSEHHIAERALPMRVAMGTLAVLSVAGGLLGIGKLLTPLEHFLEPTFEEHAHHLVPTNTTIWVGFVIGAVLGLAGIYIAYTIWGKHRTLDQAPAAAKAQRAFAPLHKLFANKWYFDEIIDVLLVKPARKIGGFFEAQTEPKLFTAAMIGSVSGLTKGASAGVRRVQTGYMRSYAGVIAAGLAVVVLYALVVK